MSDQQKPTKKLILLAAILAAGLLAAVFAASQLTASATAQTEDDGQTTDTEQPDAMEEQPPVTSQDEVDCETDPSQVHCVEEAELISAPIEDTGKSTLSVTGMATTATQPDKFSVTVGVENNATTAAEAAAGNAELVNATIAALVDIGIAEEQMATSAYNLFPVYEEVTPDEEVCIEIFPPPPRCEPDQVITGYRASSSLTVTLDTEGEVDAGMVIDTAIEAGANNVSGVFFISAEKQQEIRDGLIADAIADARHKADVAAEALDMEVSGIHAVSLEGVQFPVFARGAESLQADTQILPGEQEVTSTVSITYFINAGVMTEDGGAEAEIEEGVGVESETEAEGGVETEEGSEEGTEEPEET